MKSHPNILFLFVALLLICFYLLLGELFEELFVGAVFWLGLF